MEEDPLIPLVHVWNNTTFDDAFSASAWHAHTAAAGQGGDKENHRPDPDSADVDAEIDRIEAEILHLSSRLHHLRCAQQPESKRAAAGEVARPRTRGLSLGPLEVVAASNVNPNPLAQKQQQQQPRAAWGPKPVKQAPASRGRGLSLGPLDIAAANPRVPATAPQRRVQVEVVARPIKDPPVQRRRGVSLGPLEIHRGVCSKPAATAGARVKPFPNRLSSVREEGQHPKQHAAVPAKPWPSSNARQALDARQGTVASRAKARSVSPSRFRRQSTAKVAETRGGNAKPTETRGGSAAVGASKVVGEVKAKGVLDRTGSGGTGRRPAGSSKVRVVPSRYSLTPCSSLGAGTQERHPKPSRPGSAGGASQREIRAMVTETSNDGLTPETIGKVAELLPRIRTIPPVDESPRDSGCAKRVADLVGKQSFFTAAADDDNAVTPYQAQVLELESTEAAAAAAEEEEA
jgi:hypothetical protein